MYNFSGIIHEICFSGILCIVGILTVVAELKKYIKKETKKIRESILAMIFFLILLYFEVRTIYAAMNPTIKQYEGRYGGSSNAGKAIVGIINKRYAFDNDELDERDFFYLDIFAGKEIGTYDLQKNERYRLDYCKNRKDLKGKC